MLFNKLLYTKRVIRRYRKYRRVQSNNLLLNRILQKRQKSKTSSTIGKLLGDSIWSSNTPVNVRIPATRMGINQYRNTRYEYLNSFLDEDRIHRYKDIQMERRLMRQLGFDRLRDPAHYNELVRNRAMIKATPKGLIRA